VNLSTGGSLHFAPFHVRNWQRHTISPRPESGGFRYGYASPSCEAVTPRNRRTHAAPDSNLSLCLKATAFRLLALSFRLRCSFLRFCAYANGRPLHFVSFSLRDNGSRPRAPSHLRRQTATFAATATCASETLPALAKAQTAAAVMKPDSANSRRFHSAPFPRRQRTAPLALFHSAAFHVWNCRRQAG